MNKKSEENTLNEKKQIWEMLKNEKNEEYSSASEKPVPELEERVDSISDIIYKPEIEDNYEEDLKNQSSDFIKNGKWTEDEDRLLKRLVSQLGPKNWKKVSLCIPNRTAVQCLHRWTKILQPGLIKGPWTIEEDKKLTEWVKKRGPHKWSQCAEGIIGRSGKQCRERWFNSLNPQVKKGEWTAVEDFRIFELFSKIGSKWSKIASYFEGRTENSIKNRFYSTLRRIYADKKKYESGFNEKNNSTLDDLLVNFDDALEEKRKAIENSPYRLPDNDAYMLSRKIKRDKERDQRDQRDQLDDDSKPFKEQKSIHTKLKNYDLKTEDPGYFSKINLNNQKYFSIQNEKAGAKETEKAGAKKNENIKREVTKEESTNVSPIVKNLEPSKLQTKQTNVANKEQSELNQNKINNDNEKTNQNYNVYQTQNNYQLNNLVALNTQLASGLSLLPSLLGQPYTAFNQNLQTIQLLSELARINQIMNNTRNEINNFDAIKNLFMNLTSNNSNNFFNGNLTNINNNTPQ